MNKALYKHWLEIICSLLPNKASISSTDHSEKFVASISWELDNDPERPHKRSRILVIEIPQETVEDYKNKSVAKQKADDKKLAQQIKELLQDFNPDHDAPIGQEAPEKRLVIGNAILDS